MVLVIGFLLLVSLLHSSLLVAAGDALNRLMPRLPILGKALNLMLSLGVIAVLFASIDKDVPDVRVPWRDLWVGAAATSVLFNLGKTAIGLYIGKSSFDSTYGAAGSRMVLLLWTSVRPRFY